ncbi:EF-hand domain-containing protein [Sandaracinobacter sp. RS1-74]|uniref:EF-hand domain-containing protein n=1 Tax=Sandaracinobacteroides sayramensis TaxID=2913411 RepID=UPI001ED9D7EF|nr:EF-hand domain-containing protein [Sandaracinobacteroides sayramensis]MCG2839828.1 EF-hand domain-containing protein [Sandaracinobacteroides sayramensis]
MPRTALLILPALVVALPLSAQTPPSSQMPAAAKGGAQPGRFWEAVDANKDGVITREEWIAAGRNPDGFAMMDLNKDGKVTREEGRAAMQKAMQMRNM